MSLSPSLRDSLSGIGTYTAASGIYTAPGTYTFPGTYTAATGTYTAPGTYTASGTYTAPGT